MFAEGEAQLSIRHSRELQTLTAFDVTRSRPALAEDLGRFTGAAAIAELALRFVRDNANPALYNVVRRGLDGIAATNDSRCTTLAVAWHLIAELGFAPAIDRCSSCHAEVPLGDSAAFSHPAGGTLCPSCAALHGRTRTLPASARSELGAWLRGRPHTISSDSAARAHQRLLREFVHEHLADNAPFRAFEVWERGSWSAPVGAALQTETACARGRPVILGTAGHIDHGKTALVKALTGVDTDRLPEERRRGITIELGFAPLMLDGVGTVGVVDVPGHEAFVRTMVAGAAGIDMALVVIAADEGVMPQTREHLAILEFLGVRQGVMALSKRDLVDAEWLELVREDVRGSLAGTALAAAPIVAVSAPRTRARPGRPTSRAGESRRDDTRSLFGRPISPAG